MVQVGCKTPCTSFIWCILGNTDTSSPPGGDTDTSSPPGGDNDPHLFIYKAGHKWYQPIEICCWEGSTTGSYTPLIIIDRFHNYF